jgi:hypothetical protein
MDKFLEVKVTEAWKEIGKKEANEGTEIEDFVRVLWKEILKDQGYNISIRSDNKTTNLCITKCPIFELAEETGMHEWLYHLACHTDFYNTPAFNKNIGLKRTKTLIKGNECCNHQYFYVQ